MPRLEVDRLRGEPDGELLDAAIVDDVDADSRKVGCFVSTVSQLSNGSDCLVSTGGRFIPRECPIGGLVRVLNPARSNALWVRKFLIDPVS
jgi:hypothetical protein